MVDVLMRVSMIELDSTDNVDLPMQLSGTGRARHLSNSTVWNALITRVAGGQFHTMELPDCYRATSADNEFQRRTLAIDDPAAHTSPET